MLLKEQNYYKEINRPLKSRTGNSSSNNVSFHLINTIEDMMKQLAQFNYNNFSINFSTDSNVPTIINGNDELLKAVLLSAILEANKLSGKETISLSISHHIIRDDVTNLKITVQGTQAPQDQMKFGKSDIEGIDRPYQLEIANIMTIEDVIHKHGGCLDVTSDIITVILPFKF